MQSPSKLCTLESAIGEVVTDGASIAMGTALETMIPFAAGHEIIRQKKRNLTLIGPISDILFDQLIGAGVVEKVQAAWVGNVITGSGYNFRRAVEGQHLKVEDHSNLTIAMALKAGAMGVPFMPTRTALGSDLFTTNPGLGTTVCPFTGQTLTAVAAICPDVAIIHVQRSDEYGNCHVWGNLGITREACMASRHVVITAEQIVPTEVITSDPNRIVTPGFRVRAVAHVPWGAHPSPVPGFYNRDHQAFLDYQQQSRTEQGYHQWKTQWVDDVGSQDDYIQKLGNTRLENLKIKHHLYSEVIDNGY